MSGRVVRRAYKYRFYPTPQQAELLNRTFGSVRYVHRGRRHHHVGAERIGRRGPEHQQVPGRDALSQQRGAHGRIAGYDRAAADLAGHPGP
jgi:hypothetical protein